MVKSFGEDYMFGKNDILEMERYILPHPGDTQTSWWVGYIYGRRDISEKENI